MGRHALVAFTPPKPTLFSTVFRAGLHRHTTLQRQPWQSPLRFIGTLAWLSRAIRGSLGRRNFPSWSASRLASIADAQDILQHCLHPHRQLADQGAFDTHLQLLPSHLRTQEPSQGLQQCSRLRSRSRNRLVKACGSLVPSMQRVRLINCIWMPSQVTLSFTLLPTPSIVSWCPVRPDCVQSSWRVVTPSCHVRRTSRVYGDADEATVLTARLPTIRASRLP